MKHFSTGTGIAVLGVCILAATFVATHHGGSEAFAQQPIAQPSQMPSTEGREFLAKSTRSDADSLLSSSTTCYLNEVNWFGSPHFIPLCIEHAVGVPPLYAADVNGDGASESFLLDYQTFVNVIENGQPTGWGIRISRAVPSLDSSGKPRFQSQLVFDSATANSWLKQAYPWVKSATLDAGIGRGGWLDMDSDGDLDLVMFASLWDGVSTPLYGELWFENTGYQASPPPNPYDLDQDGEVGAGDISVLLLNYSG
jgi:hypothetical protein